MMSLLLGAGLFLKIAYFYYLTFGVKFVFGTINDLFFVLFFFILFSFRKKNIVFSLVILNLFFSFVLFGNAIYFRFFGDFISFATLFQFNQLWELGPSILSILYRSDIIFCLDFLILILLLRTSLIRRRSENIYSVFKKSRTAFISIILLITQFGVNQYWFNHSPLWRSVNPLVIKNHGLFNFYLLDLTRILHSRLIVRSPDKEKIKEARDYFRNKKAIHNHPPSQIKNKNIIVIVEESLQGFVIGLKLNGQEITPNLNKLAKKGLYYSNMFDETAQGRSSDSEFAVQNSLYPLDEGAACYLYPFNTYDTLAQILKKEKGTINIYAYPAQAGYWNRSFLHKKFGFDFGLFEQNFDPGEQIGFGLADHEFFSQMSNYLVNQSTPFYSVLYTVGNHLPYNIPEIYQKINVGEFKETRMGRYLNSVHYADWALGLFIEKLKENKLLENSIILIYGDHDGWIPIADIQKSLNQDPSAINIVLDDKIPLIILDPDLKSPREITDICGTVDIGPTLLGLLGIDSEQYFLMGRDLLNLKNSDRAEKVVTYRDGTCLNKDLVYLSPVFGDNSGCFDFHSKKNIDLSRCEKIRAISKSTLEVSDDIFRGDLIKNFKTDQFKNH